MEIAEIQRRSALIPRTVEGKKVEAPINRRQLSQLLLDEAAAIRTFVRSGEQRDHQSDYALCRIISLACELAPMAGINDLSGLMDKLLPKGGTDGATPTQ